MIRRYRRQIGSCWRKFNPGQQALLVLAHLRKGETFAALAAGFGIGTATAWRYVREAVALLAARAPRLRDALRAAKKAGHAFVVIDGTLIPIDRVTADRPFYSGKDRKNVMNLQVISSPGRNKPASQKAVNSAHAKLRAPGERASAQLKTWDIARKLRCCPWRAGQIAKAIHVLQTREIAG